jgi:hypothetical protein
MSDHVKSASLPVNEPSIDEEGRKSKARSVMNIVSENSDVLAYCDSAPGEKK